MRIRARDLRDPKELGEMLLRNRKKNSKPLSRHYDDQSHYLMNKCPDYTGELTGYYTAQEYRAELQSRDDRYAASTLAAIEAGLKPDNNYGE